MPVTIPRFTPSRSSPASTLTPISAEDARLDAVRRLHELVLQRSDDSIALRAIKMLLDITDSTDAKPAASTAHAKVPSQPPTQAPTQARNQPPTQPPTHSPQQAPAPSQADPSVAAPSPSVRPPSITDQLAAPPLDLPPASSDPLFSSRMLHMQPNERELYGTLAATVAAAGSLVSTLPAGSNDARHLANLRRELAEHAQALITTNPTGSKPTQ